MTNFAFRISTRFLLAILVVFLFSCTKAASPEAQDPGAIAVEGLLGSPLLLANGDSTVYARIRISTIARPARERGPVNLALAIDTSGSMEGEAIKAARQASLQMIDALKDGDRVALVIFNTKAELIQESAELDDELRRNLRQQISAIEARGTTEMAAGLQLALNQVSANLDPKGINRIVLLGDGIPNNASDIEDNARSAASHGIAITTLGLGLDYDETLMGKVADLSGGRYRYIESVDKLAGFFHEELERINAVYGRNAHAVLTPGPGVRIDAVVGIDTPSDAREVHVPLGDIARGDKRDILVRMTVTPRKAGVPIELLDTSITFDDAIENAGRLERRVYLGAHTTLDQDAIAKAKNPDIDLSAAIAEASATTLRALELSKNGYNTRARTMLTEGATAALAQAARTPSAELSKLADNMSSVAKDIPVEDRVAPPKESQDYDFADDQELAPAEAPAPAPMAPPSVLRKRKEVHQSAIDALH